MQQLVLFGKQLSRQEFRIASLVAEGLPNKSIAQKMGLTHCTIRAYLSKIYKETGCGNRTDLAVRFLKRQL